MPRMFDVWTLDDAQAFRCTLAQVGCPRPAAEVLSAASPQELAQQLAPFALRQLARLAQGHGFPAVAAARAILQAAEAKGPFPPLGDAPAPLPDWVQPGRLAYASAAKSTHLRVSCLGNANYYDSRSQSGDISHGGSEGGAVSGSGGCRQLSSNRETDSSQKPPPLKGDTVTPPDGGKETFDDPFERTGPSARKYA